MKIQIALVGLSLAVVLVMGLQAVRQELDLRNLKSRVAQTSAEIKQKEDAIMQVKDKIDALKVTLASTNIKMDQLKKKKQDTMKSTEESEKSLQACNADKANAEKSKMGMTETLAKLKADHTAAKSKAEKEVQGLKQQILDRDKAICAFADTTNAQVQKLCTFA